MTLCMPRTGRRTAAMGLAVLYLAAAAQAGPKYSQRPGYRGPDTAGTYPARGLLKEWPENGPPLLWKQSIGLSAAPVTVWDGKVYAVGGSDAWLHVFTIDGKKLGKARVGNASWKRFSFTRSTPLVGEGVAVATTPNSDMYGIDLEKMEQRWKVNTYKSFGSGKGNMGWGLPESPMFNPPLVIFNTVSRDDLTPPLVAVDIRDGTKAVWGMDPGIGKNHSAGDNSAAFFQHNGRNMIAAPTYCYQVCLDADTGKVLWELPSKGHDNLTPVYHDGLLLLTVHRETGPAEERWWPAWPGLPVGPPWGQPGAAATDAAAAAAAEDACDPGASAAKPGTAGSAEQVTFREQMNKSKWGPEEMVMLRLSDDGLEARVLWGRLGGTPRYSHAVILDGRVYCYGSPDAPTWRSEDGLLPPLTGKLPRTRGCRLLCLDAETGKVIDDLPCATPGHLVAADGRVYAVDLVKIPHPLDPTARMREGPRIRLVRPTRDGMEIAGQLQPMGYNDIPQLRDVEWAASVPPVIAEGRLFVSYGDVLAYDLRGGKYRPLRTPPPLPVPPLLEEVPFPSTNNVDTIRPEDVPALVTQLGSRLEDHRKTAVTLLCRTNTPRTAELSAELASLMTSGGDPAWQRQVSASQVLARLGPESRTALPTLQKALPAAIKQRDGALARLILATIHSIDTQGAAPAADSVADLLLRRDPYVQYIAASILKRMGPAAKDGANALAESMRSKDGRVQTEAGLALCAIGRHAAPALPRLRDQLLDAIAARDRVLTGRITHTLLAIDPGGIRPIAPRITAFLQDPDAERRQLAGAALKRAGGAGAAAVPAMVKALKSDDENELAAVSAALAELESEAGLVAAELAKVIDEDEGAVRITAAKILERMGERAAPAVDTLARALGGGNPALARAAADTLASIGPKADGAVEALVAALKQEERELARSAAAALGALGPRTEPASAPALLAALRHDDTTIRTMAARSLDQVGRSPTPALMEMLEKGPGHLRGWAIDTLAQYPGNTNDAVRALTGALASGDRRLVDAAMRALGRLGPKAGGAAPALLSMAHTHDARRACQALRTIRQIGSGAEPVVPGLLELAASTNQGIVCEAVYALSGMGHAAHHTVAPLLAVSGKWHNQDVDRAVSTALEKIKTNNVPPAVRDVTAACGEGETVVITLPISDDDDVVSYADIWCGRPRHGSVTAPRRRSWHQGRITYHNTRGFVGEDTFEWRVTDGMRSNSPTAKVTVTITPDTAAPGIIDAAVPLGTNRAVVVTFSEPLRAGSTTSANFSIEPGVQVLDAALSETGEAVALITTPLTAYTEYTVTARDMRDRAQAGNAGDSTTTFVYRPLVAGLTCTCFEGTPVFPGKSRKLADVDASPMTVRSILEVDAVHPGIPNRPERCTLRFDGVLQAPRQPDGRASGSYTFFLASTGQSRLYLDGNQLADNRRGDKGRTVTLASGPHRLTVFYSHSGKSTPTLALSWSGPGIKKQTIPPGVLFHQSATRKP